MRSEPRDASAAEIALRPAGTDKPVRRTFPGPRGADAALRVAVERPAYAELIAHAKESLEAEVCGVLVGQVCEDDEGQFVQVEAVIRGSAATQGATHVTFTQATWDAIYASLERDYPKGRIVGWYHTHPGFGVVFSEMDLFIQRNFFAGSGQIALVTDPMSGAVAIVVNMPEGIKYLERFWVDAREQPAKVPSSAGSPMSAAGKNETPGAPDLAVAVKALEARVSQLIQAHDDQRTTAQRFLYFVGFTVCFAVIAAVGYFIYNQYTTRFEPPRLNSYVPVPVQVGDKTVLVGVGVVQWDIPEEVNALMVQMAKAKLEQEKKLSNSGEKPAPELNNPVPGVRPSAVPNPNKEPKP